MAQQKDSDYYRIKSEITANETYLRNYEQEARQAKDPNERRQAELNATRTRNKINNLRSELRNTYGE